LLTPAAYPKVRINRKGADRIASGHPWIFSSDILERGTAQPGDTVTVVDPKGQILGIAHYSSTSQIALRLLSGRMETIDQGFFRRRLTAAEAFRKRVVANSDAYRLVHGEADQLPGLVIDRYREYFTIQTLDQGMDRAKPEIANCLVEQFAPKGIVERNDASVRKRESLPLQTGVLFGEVPQRAPIYMNGLELALHIANRCESVEAVDSSTPSLKTAESNRARNSIGNVEFREADVFDLLNGYGSARRHFDTVVLDPPAFAKSRSALEGAARGYKEINLRAMQLLGPGGILVTCSCSHHLSEAMLLEIVAGASLDTKRRLKVLERRTQSQDHPILLTVPETLYLKCLILEVVEA
jgi:23S rRNA (cytosine1962-C5)-methyltransferase